MTGAVVALTLALADVAAAVLIGWGIAVGLAGTSFAIALANSVVYQRRLTAAAGVAAIVGALCAALRRQPDAGRPASFRRRRDDHGRSGHRHRRRPVGGDKRAQTFAAPDADRRRLCAGPWRTPVSRPLELPPR
jgi:hypothetical protein